MKLVNFVRQPLTFLALTTLACFSFKINPAHTETSSVIDSNSISIAVPQPEQTTTGICNYFLEPVINSIVESPTVKSAKWAIVVQTLDRGQTLYSRNPNSYMIPASNIKLLTTAAALKKLDPDGGNIRSKSIREWITITNLHSNNNYADVLLSYIGGYNGITSGLSELGISNQGYRIYDGSGLSRKNLATPTVMVETLRAMSLDPDKEVFLASLPLAGVSGTLRNRMRSTIAQGKVRAKTGTLRGVRALSGYVENPHYGTLLFSIIANQPGQSGQALVKAIDDVVVQLSLVSHCE